LVLHFRGGTINTMVLAGLVIALGEVVDDAIIDVENIMRRLRLNRAGPEPRPAFQVVLNASLEVRSAVVYGSLIVALVLMPVFLLPGLSGSFFRPLAVSYILAILASLQGCRGSKSPAADPGAAGGGPSSAGRGGSFRADRWRSAAGGDHSSQGRQSRGILRGSEGL
jgi:hypothetical protein